MNFNLSKVIKKIFMKKMNNHTVVQFMVIAKERGIRGYYKLRKAELIQAFEAARLVE